MGSFGFLLSSGGVDSGAAETEELPSASPIAQLQDGICKNIFALFCKTTQSRTYISGRCREVDLEQIVDVGWH